MDADLVLKRCIGKQSHINTFIEGNIQINLLGNDQEGATATT